MFAVIERKRDRAMFMLAYYAALRASEVGMLRPTDYSPATNKIYIRRLKGSASGHHLLVGERLRALRAWLKVRGPGGGPLFPSRLGNPISRRQLDQLMKAYGKRAGLHPGAAHFHILKHSCATHLVEMNVNLRMIQDMIGHKQIGNTLKYLHISDAARDRAAAELGDWLRAA